MLRRGPSADSYNSNPDADLGSSEEGARFPGGLGLGSSNLLRVPTPIPGTPASRPPRDSLVRQSLAVPNGGLNGVSVDGYEQDGIPRRSFRDYPEFPEHGVPMSRAPTRPQTQYPGTQYSNQPHAPSQFVNREVEEGTNMIDEEFVLRPKESRLKRFANALLKPFRAIKSVFRLPKYLKRRRSIVTQPVSAAASSGYHIRDRTPSSSSIQQIYSRKGAEQEREPTMMFSETMTGPPTMLGMGTEHGGPRSPEHSDSAHGHSATHHSYPSLHSPRRSDHSHRDTIKPTGHTVRSPNTTHSRATRTTRTSLSPFSALGGVKERSSRTLSSISHCSALLHQFTLLFRALRELYHLPWMANPPRRIAVDFIPAFSKRSKYCVHRGLPRVPPSVAIAAAAARNMEPSEGKSWYRPSPQQLEKQLKRGKGSGRHDHGHGHGHGHSHCSLADAYAGLFPDEALRHRYGHGNHPFYAYGHNPPTSMPMPFPQPQTSGPYAPQTSGAFYIVPGPPPPQAAGVTGCGNGNGTTVRVPPPARPPSVVSFSLRPGPRPVQNGGGSGQPAGRTSDPNNITTAGGPPPRSEVQRPPPAAQPMYMLVHAPPPGVAGQPPHHHLPPGYTGNLPMYHPYPYSPPWTPTPQRI